MEQTTKILIADYQESCDLCNYVQGYTRTTRNKAAWRLFKRLFLENPEESWHEHRFAVWYFDAVQYLKGVTSMAEWMKLTDNARAIHAMQSMLSSLINSYEEEA
jgi:hypothetical protein